MQVFAGLDIEQIFYGLTTSVTLCLAVLTLHHLLSGWWRQYYLLALFLVLMLAGVVPATVSYLSSGNWAMESVQKMYWTLAGASQIAMFLFVLQLIHRVGIESAAQKPLLRGLTPAAFAGAGISALVHSDLRLNSFMTVLTRDLTFMAALLNMVLWRYLIGGKKRDFLLLAVSAGVGIQCTGDAIGHSFRFLGRHGGSSRTILEFGNVVMALASVITIAIWHTAFSRIKYRLPSTDVLSGQTEEPALPVSKSPSI
jgi:hypothetical protein